MLPDLDVDLSALRRAAVRVRDTAALIRTGSAPPTVTVPGWTTAAAAAELDVTARSAHASIAGALDATGRALAVAADGYADADDRAAGRLTAAG